MVYVITEDPFGTNYQQPVKIFVGINLAKAILVLQNLSGMSSSGISVSIDDVSGDNQIGLEEVVFIIQNASQADKICVEIIHQLVMSEADKNSEGNDKPSSFLYLTSTNLLFWDGAF